MNPFLTIFLGCLLTGCLAPGTSETSRLWSLPPAASAGPKVRVFLPAELRTPKVVAGDASGAPVHRDLDRWATPLAEALAGLISEELLIGLPVREAVIDVRKLRVDARGDAAVEASYRMTVRSFEGGPDITLEGIRTFRIHKGADSGETEKQRILGAYESAARLIAEGMRKDYDRQSNGEVAKPSEGVTVPGK